MRAPSLPGSGFPVAVVQGWHAVFRNDDGAEFTERVLMVVAQGRANARTIAYVLDNEGKHWTRADSYPNFLRLES